MNQVPRSSYLLVIATLSGSLIGLAMVLVLPFILNPKEYAYFSLSFASAQLVSSIAFEWIRVSVVRYAGKSVEKDRIRLRRQLKNIYTIIALLVLLFSTLFLIISLWIKGFEFAALILAAAGSQGILDGRGAWARANFDNIRLSIVSILRAASSAILAAGLAWITHSGGMAIVGLICSNIISLLFYRDRITFSVRSVGFLNRDALYVAKFGFSAAMGTNLALAVPTILRIIIVDLSGVSKAGGILFAFDISQRLFSALGMSLNLLHFQTLVRTVDESPIGEAIRRARQLVGLKVLIFAGVATVGAAISNSASQIFVPVLYRAEFADHLPLFSVLMAVLCVRQYAVDSLFIAFQRVAYIWLPSVITLGICWLAYAGIRFGWMPASQIFLSILFASIVGLVTSFVLTRKLPGPIVPIKHIVVAGAAALCAVVVARVAWLGEPLANMAVKLAISIVAYLVVVVVFLPLGRGAGSSIVWRRTDRSIDR